MCAFSLYLTAQNKRQPGHCEAGRCFLYETTSELSSLKTGFFLLCLATIPKITSMEKGLEEGTRNYTVL